MKGPADHKMFALRNEKGIVLPVALMLLVLLAVMGGAAVVFTRTDLKISGNYKTITASFYRAEAGIAHAKSTLNGTSDWDTLLPGSPVTCLGISGCTYTITDDNDDADQTTDSNNIVIATATGTSGSSTDTVEVVVRRNAGIPSVPAAVVLVSDGEVELEMEDNATVSGFDESATCADKPGFVWQASELDLDLDILDGGSLTGNPANRQFSNPPDATDYSDVASLRSLKDTWASLPGVVNISGNNPPLTLGTALSPQITDWNDPGEVEDSFTGYGILIIDGEWVQEADFEFHGLILADVDDDFDEIEIEDGNSQEIHGALIVFGELDEVDLEGNVQVRYNCSDVSSYAAPLVSPTMSIVSWRQVF